MATDHSVRIRIRQASDGMLKPNASRSLQTMPCPTLEWQPEWLPLAEVDGSSLRLDLISEVLLVPVPHLGGRNFWLVLHTPLDKDNLGPPPTSYIERHETKSIAEDTLVLGEARSILKFRPHLRRWRTTLTRTLMERALLATDRAPWFVRGTSPRISPAAIRVCSPLHLQLWISL